MAASGSGSGGQIQPLKIPDAVVALAQAAAKAKNNNSAAADATDKYLPGWPLFSPPKMQLTKCAKCPREFCSSVALRRHTRVHRRALKIDKDFPKNRDHLAAFWDKVHAFIYEWSNGEATWGDASCVDSPREASNPSSLHRP